VFAVDLRLKYSDYIKGLTANSNSKTIFITNPATKSACNLFNYAQTIQLPEMIPIIDQLSKILSLHSF
jgi:hypothetical protein